jgi:NAD(P)-dependent dehydrogenase (short-subunit alcohol dehydrogenase family)
MSTAFITGCDRGLGLSLTKRLAERGWRIFAGSYLPQWEELSSLAALYPTQITVVPLDIASDESVRAAKEAVEEHVTVVDLVINNAAVISPHSDRGIRDGQDYEDLLRVFNVNTLGALRVTEAFLPLLQQSEWKRICFVSSEAGSISRSRRNAWFGYCMSKAALNRGVMYLFRRQRPQGYTFRLLHPGWMKTYMLGTRNERAELDPDDVATSALNYFLADQDEDRLVMRDWQGQEWPW